MNTQLVHIDADLGDDNAGCADSRLSSSAINLRDIPWNDVIFPHILKYLSWRDLFRMRRVSLWSLTMINDYFKTLTVVDLGPVSRRFTARAFCLITSECTNIRILNLSNCKWVTNDVLLPVVDKNPNIIVFDISACYEITNVCLQKLATNCSRVKSLKLKECHWVGAATINEIAFHCFDLEDVDLTSCWEVTDEAAIELIAKCSNLKRLSLSRIYGITDRTLTALASYAKDLEFLDVSGCWRITDYGIRMVGEYCLSLVHLIVGDCRDVTDASLTHLKERGVYVDVPIKNRSQHISIFLSKFGRIRLQV